MEPIKFTDATAKKTREYVIRIEEIKKALAQYLSGVRDGLGLPDDYYVDIATMSFKQKEKLNDSTSK